MRLTIEKATKKFFVSEDCFNQTQEVVSGRAKNLGIEVVIGDHNNLNPAECFGVLLQYPTRKGCVHDYSVLLSKIREAGGLSVLACDLLALVVLKSPAALGADIAVGNAQRFGIPLACGGPHPGFFCYSRSF